MERVNTEIHVPSILNNSCFNGFQKYFPQCSHLYHFKLKWQLTWIRRPIQDNIPRPIDIRCVAACFLTSLLLPFSSRQFVCHFFTLGKKVLRKKKKPTKCHLATDRLKLIYHYSIWFITSESNWWIWGGLLYNKHFCTENSIKLFLLHTWLQKLWMSCCKSSYPRRSICRSDH